MGENESINEALIGCVKACGGSKQVAHKLWPEKAMDAAQRHLLACLNEDKPERLSPDHLLMLLRMAREAGHHGGMNYIAAVLGYAAPSPIQPHDELAELQRAFIESVRASEKLAARMERLHARPALKGVA